MPRKTELPDNPYASVSDAAKRLGVTNQWITEMCRAGVFDGAFKINPEKNTSSWLIPMASLDAYIAEKKTVKEKSAQAITV